MSNEQTDLLFDRVRRLIGVDRFRDKMVVVLGVGSGGGKCVEHLAKSGVSRLALADPEALGIENVCRHVCGLRDVGRLKVAATKDFILDRNPDAQVQTFARAVDESSRMWLSDLLTTGNAGRPVSLVVCGTDNERSKNLVNQVCVAARVPAVFAGCFEKACGGEVIRYLPGEACYGCISSFLRREGLHDSVGRKTFDYSTIDVDGIADARPEPGLGMDIEFIALIQAKMALLTLLGPNGPLPDFDGNYILFGNRPTEGLFTSHLQSFIYRVPPQQGCLVCGVRQDRETQERARKILAAVDVQ